MHANKPTTSPKGSTKIWVHADGTSTVQYPTNIKASDLKEIQEWIFDNIALIAEKWNDGVSNFKDVEGKTDRTLVTDFFN